MYNLNLSLKDCLCLYILKAQLIYVIHILCDISEGCYHNSGCINSNNNKVLKPDRPGSELADSQMRTNRGLQL